MIFRKIIFAALGVCAVALLVAASRPAPSITLVWDYPASEIATVKLFRIYSATNVTDEFTIYATQSAAVVSFLAKFPATNAQRFFRVKALGTNGQESGWNIK